MSMAMVNNEIKKQRPFLIIINDSKAQSRTASMIYKRNFTPQNPPVDFIYLLNHF